MTTRKRTKYIQELAAANLNALFGGDLSRQGMESTVTRAHEMVRQMTSDFQILSNVAEVLRSDYSVYSHSINVCMLAMGWGRFLGMPESRIRTLGVGGMLHDAGKAKLPRYLLSKPGNSPAWRWPRCSAIPAWATRCSSPSARCPTTC